MKLYKLWLIFIYLLIFNLYFFSLGSIFNSVDWSFDKEHKGIKLYIQKNRNIKVNFYKAEAVIKNIKAEILYNNLISFNKYTEIFDRVPVYKSVKKISNNKHIVYAVLDFSPIKKRDYYIELRYYINQVNNRKEYTLEWFPYSDKIKNEYEDKTCIRAKTVFGRWIIKELDNNTVKISVEYFNDFEVKAPKFFIVLHKKNSTIKVLSSLINYSKNKKVLP